MAKETSYYLCFKAAKKENKKIAKLTKKLQARLDKAIANLKKKSDADVSKFVVKHHGYYINDEFKEYIRDISFKKLTDERPMIYHNNYCRPREIACFTPGEVPFFKCESLPDGFCPNSWSELKKYLNSLEPKSYFIIDSDNNSYADKEFVKTIESKL